MNLEINKIYNMDCLDGLKLLDDECIDLTVTSPPYDNLRTYNGYSFDFENIAKELYRVTKQGGVVVWVVGDQVINGSESGTSFRQALYFKEIGFNLHDTMIYEKNGMASPPDSNRYYQKFEYMFVFSKGKPKTTNLIEDRKNTFTGIKKSHKRNPKTGKVEYGNEIKLREMGRRFNIWIYNVGGKNFDLNGFDHPAIFPEELANDHIISWSNKDDVVLDPFMGSGTTAKMAILNDRKWIGFEISEEYVELTNNRIDGIYPQLSIFDFYNEGEKNE